MCAHGISSSVLNLLDGPGPRNIHSINAKVCDWILFRTFQGIVQIKCEFDDCKSLVLLHTREDPEYWHHKTLTITSSATLDFKRIQGGMYYQSLKIYPANPNGSLQVDFVEVTFHGPDYPDNYVDAESCLMGGVVMLMVIEVT